MNFKSFINENYTYTDAAGMNLPVTRDKAEKEVLDHGDQSDWEAFLKEVGDKPQYTSKELLTWLGY